MTAEVFVIGTDKANPAQVLAHALSMAQRGDLRDVVIVSTLSNGKLEIAYAGCNGQDLAAAALIVQREAEKVLEID